MADSSNDLAALLAGAAKTNANFNFDEINKSYYQGLDEAYKRRTQDAFQNGVPMKDGVPDWPAISATLLQKGGIGGAAPSIEAGKLSVQESIRQGLINLDDDRPRPTGVPPSMSGNPATQTEPKAVTSNDPTMTVSPRQVAVANAPQPSQPPIVPRPVPTLAVPPQPPQPPPQPAMPPQPPQQPAPQVAQVPAPLSQAAPNQVVQDRFSGTPAATAGMITDPTLGGLIPPGRTIEQQLDFLGRREKWAASTGVRDAAKVWTSKIQAIQDALKQYRESGLKERQSITEPAVKMAIERLGQSQEKTSAIADGITVSHDLMAQLDAKAGIFSGAMATQKLWMAKVAEVLNITGVDPRTTNTEAFSALVGKKVAQTVKSFGSGTSITNQDREYAAKMEAGDIKLDETSMRRILQITDKINRGIIDKHNQQVDALVKSRPELASLAQTMKVDAPPAYGGGPPVPGARRGDDNKWYVPDPRRPGKYLQVK